MSGFQPFQFEPTYFPGEEPTESEEESEREAESLSLSARVGNTEWWICGGNCVAIAMADKCFCCQELDALNPKFGEAMIECITGYCKFRIVCLDMMCSILLLWQFTTNAVGLFVRQNVYFN